MTHVARRCLLVALFVAALTSSASGQDYNAARVRERLKSGVLRWGGDAEGGAPYVLRDPTDLHRVIGYEVELADALAEVLGRQLGIPLRAEFVQYEWVTLTAGLTRSKDFDVIIAGKEIGEEDAEQLIYSRPYNPIRWHSRP